MKGIANLGVMSVLGSPMLIKLLPKQLLGNAIKKIATHYLQSGKHLSEAMQDAALDALAAIDLGLNPGFWKNLTKSRVSKEFVENFRTSYLEPFFAKYPNLDRKEFSTEASKAIKHIIKNIEQLIDDLTPTEQDVHAFFSEGEIQASEERMNEGEALLLRRIRDLGEIPPRFLELLRFEHLLFQAILYFFRQKLANSKEMKAIKDDLDQLKIMRSLQDADRQRDQVQQALEETNRKLDQLMQQIAQGRAPADAQQQRQSLQNTASGYREQASLLSPENLREAASLEVALSRSFAGFSQQVGRQLAQIKDELSEARRDIMAGLRHLDDHLFYQDRKMDEMQEMLRMILHHMNRGSSEYEARYVTRTIIKNTLQDNSQSQWQGILRKEAARLGVSYAQAEQIIDYGSASPLPSRAPAEVAKERVKVPHAIVEVMGQGDNDPRTFYVYMSPRVLLGRHSSNDLVLYWYPLPDPPDIHNPEWKDWQGSGACHPSLNISSQHLELIWVGTGLRIIDKSSKGTFVGGERIPKGQLFDVPDGATISPANTVNLSYMILRDEDGKPVGWRLRRLNNYPRREEYLYLDNGVSLRLGGSSVDHLAFRGEGVRPAHAKIRREGTRILLEPAGHPIQINQDPIQEATEIRQGSRVMLGQQTLWIFPPFS